MNEKAFRKQLADEGYVVGDVAQRQPGIFNDTHAHDYAVKLLVLDGEITVTTADGTATTCRANDTFELAAGVPHTEQIGPRGLKVLAGRKTT